MKYRMLSHEELEALSDELKHFLIVNGVDNDAWVEMNQNDVSKATKLVEMFSDTVLHKVYEKIKFIEHRSPVACLVFKLGKEDIELISLNAKNQDLVDLSTPESIHYALVNHPNELTIFKTKKAYNQVREDEIHEMLEQGCVNSSEAFWMSLEKVL